MKSTTYIAEITTVKRGYFNQWGYFDHIQVLYLTAIAQRTKIINLSHLYLYFKQTDPEV